MALRGGRGGGIRYYVDADTNGIESALGRVDGRLDGIGSRLTRGALITGAAAAGAAFTGLALAAKVGYGELTEAENALAQTEARLKSTGGVANVTANDVTTLAGRLQALTGIQDDVIQGGQNVLLTFTNVRNEVGRGNDIFNRATRSSLDLSVAFGKDLQGSAIMLGKALNDPIRGITALGRAGVQFTADQKEQIKTFVESGRTLEAQKIILSELDKQVGGASAAAGDTLTGKWERLKRAGEGIAETATRAMLPALTSVADRVLDDVVPKLDVAAGQIAGIWDRPGMTPGEKFTASWDAIAATGVPDQVKEGIYQGLTAVGTNGPRFIMQGLQEAPWPAKGVMAAILLAKLGPAMKLAGGALIPGLTGGSGGRGLASTVAGRAAPVPVIVTNPGFGAPGAGLPGGGKGAPGATIPGFARPLAAGALGLPLAGGAALIAGGMALDSADQKYGLLGSSRSENAAKFQARIDAEIAAWRKGGPALQKEIQKHSLGDQSGNVAKWTAQANAAVDAYARSVVSRGPKVTRSMDAVVNGALRPLQGMAPVAARLAADSIVRATAQMESKGKATRGTTKALVDALEAQFGRLPGATRRLVAQAMPPLEAFNRSLSRIRTAAGETATAVEQSVNRWVAAANRAPTASIVPSWLMSSGGLIPGTYTGVDTIPAMLSPGEVVLNPTQQRIVGIDRIMETLARTGGQIGGSRFSGGGVAMPAGAQAWLAEARAAKYSQPLRGQRAYMDCSEFATGMAQKFGYKGPISWTGPGPGSAWDNSRPAKGSELVVFGFRGMSSAGSQRHMGIRIGGTWYDFGGSGLDTGDSRWDSIRVPVGTEGFGAEAAETDTRAATRGKGTPKELTPTQRLAKALKAAGIDTPGRAAGILAAGAGDPAAGVRGTSFSATQQRGISSAGRAAAVAALAAGGEDAVSKAAEARDDAEREASIRALNVNLTQVQGSIIKHQDQRRKLWDDIQRAGDPKRKLTKAQRRRIITDARAARKRLKQDIDALREVEKAVVEELNELDFAAQIDAAEDAAAALAATPAAEPAPDPVATGPTPDQQAELDQANARADAAAAESRAFGAFVSALQGSGDIDPRAGATIVHVHGSLVQENQVASWLIGTAERNASRRTSVMASPA